MLEKFPDYKGHTLYVDFDDDPDGFQKLWYFCHMPDGSEKVLDTSPYEPVDFDMFMAWVDLGYPDRTTLKVNGPLRKRDFEKLLTTKTD